MTWGMLAGLAGLAVVDSTSVGTLAVPLWLMLRLGEPVRPVLVYLATIAGFYWLVGLALVFGLDHLEAVGAVLASSTPVTWAQLALGVALFLAGLRLDRRRAGAAPRPARWHSRVTGDAMPDRTAVGLALGAGVVEIASMLPYLAAIGLLSAGGVAPATASAVLVGYVGLMIVPGLGALVALRCARGRAERALDRLRRFLESRGDQVLGWVLLVVGFFLTGDAVQRLELFE
ncbi:GAP family protein [Saccharomonospora xinjiangensis]|uniref:GAP family protein n=1 Tax=Saccharomonospora xinjiangensis TaxID=75294 RepID=UPI00106FB8D8|nr:GAP family protein [Saccharomonospora xinjiangensis]QBQ60430.1 hypothetical protein EYD13_10380 [Saccharomonospora xinjiangensis]